MELALEFTKPIQLEVTSLQPKALTLGSSITVGAVSFDRAVKFQFSNDL